MLLSCIIHIHVHLFCGSPRNPLRVEELVCIFDWFDLFLQVLRFLLPLRIRAQRAEIRPTPAMQQASEAFYAKSGPSQ